MPKKTGQSPHSGLYPDLLSLAYIRSKDQVDDVKAEQF